MGFAQVLTVGAAVAIIVFAAVVVPKLGSSGSGFRNVVIILFANFQVSRRGVAPLEPHLSWFAGPVSCTIEHHRDSPVVSCVFQLPVVISVQRDGFWLVRLKGP